MLQICINNKVNINMQINSSTKMFGPRLWILQYNPLLTND